MENYTEDQITINGSQYQVPIQQSEQLSDFQNEKESELNLLALYNAKYYLPAKKGTADITLEEYETLVSPSLMRQGRLEANFIDLEQ